MRFEHRSTGAALSGHMRAGILFGALSGAILCAFEVLIPFHGRYGQLGDPLARVVFNYLLTVSAIGMLGALVVGLLSARTSFGKSPARYQVFYFVMGLCVAWLLWQTREAGFAVVRRLVTTSAGLPQLVGLVVALVIVWLWGRAAHRRKRAMVGERLGRVLFVALLLLLVAAFIAGRRSRALPNVTQPAGKGPNVVMIVLDALRADFMSLYGYDRPTTPNLDRLGEEGIVFDQAYSHGNRTIIAMPSLFTSLYPSFHGAVSMKDMISPLPPDRTTLAEMLHDAGYTTVALMTNIHLKKIFGMTQGFDRVDEFNGGCYDLSVYRLLRRAGVVEAPKFAEEAHPNATEVADGALEWLNLLRDRRFFLYLHFMDTHHPYTPPEHFAKAFDTSGQSTASKDLFRETVNLLGEHAAGDLPEEKLRELKDYYAASVRYADDEIGRVLEAVRDISRDRETIVVVTADHGDEFLEHGTLYHNNIVIEQLIHVPLIIWDPKRFAGGRRVESLVRHIDVMPTLGKLTGSTVPDAAMGQSLVPLMDGEASDLHLSTIAEGDYCTALRRENWKIVYVDSTQTFSLYDLSQDPGETTDVSSNNPRVFESMKADLDDYIERAWAARRRIHQQADPETIRQLKALGYL